MIIQSDILNWAKNYTGEPYHAMLSRSFALLVFGFCDAMATATEGDKVGKVISFNVGRKQAKRSPVMYMKNLLKFIEALRRIHPAMLASPIVPTLCFALLGLPICTVPVGFISVNILGMVFTASMYITASARAVFTRSFMLSKFAFCEGKRVAAIQTIQRNLSKFFTLFYGGILTLRRAMLTPSVLQPAGDSCKFFAAVFTSQFNLIYNLAFIRWGFTQKSFISTGHRAILCDSGAVGLH